jgi:predicted metal-dependent peptidase
VTPRAPRRASADERIRRAAEGWFISEPLLFAAFLTHRLAARPDLGTLRAGEGRVEYDPAFVQALPDRVLGELLRLEAVRIVLKHPYTRRPASGEIAWLASNITLKEHVPTRLPLPSAAEVFGDPTLSRQYFELYCDRLLDRAAGRAPGGGAGSDVEGARASALTDEGAEGLVAAHFDPASGPSITQLWQEDALAREQIDDVIRDAERSSGWGTLPGSLVAQILASQRPRLDYRKVLRSFRTRILSSRRELTRMKPSRRYGFLYMGSRHRLRTRLLVAVDVSGSISSDDLDKAFSAINRLFQYGVETLDVVHFDTQIRGPATTWRKRRRAITVEGRGGTSFEPVLRYIDEHRDYDGLIIVTDGIAPRPSAPANRSTQVLWLFHHEETYRSMHDNLAHVGDAVFMKPDAAASGRAPKEPGVWGRLRPHR